MTLNDIEGSPESTGATKPPGGGFPIQDVIVLIFCSLIAVPFADAGAEQFLHGDTWKGFVGFAVAIPTGLAGLTFHWWKSSINRRVYRWVHLTADRCWPIALCFVFLYVIGIIPHPTTVSSASPPSDAAVSAVVEPLRKQVTELQSQLTTITQERNKLGEQLSSLPKPSVYVNPLHDELIKWRVVSAIRTTIKRGGISPSCHVVINRLQENYPEDLAKDVKEILDNIGWPYEERFADSTVEREVSIRGFQHGLGHDCADFFSSVVRSTTKTKNGNQFGAPTGWDTDESAPAYLRQCGSSCFGIDVGNEEPKAP